MKKKGTILPYLVFFKEEEGAFFVDLLGQRFLTRLVSLHAAATIQSLADESVNRTATIYIYIVYVVNGVLVSSSVESLRRPRPSHTFRPRDRYNQPEVGGKIKK